MNYIIPIIASIALIVLSIITTAINVYTIHKFVNDKNAKIINNIIDNPKEIDTISIHYK